MSKRRSLRSWLLPILLLAVLLSGSPLGSSPPALAQTATNGDWTLPQNLSQSGAAAEPLLFMAADGLAYVLWRDALAGPLFTQGVLENGEYSWLPPTPVSFPFGAARPTLVAVGETIYAFWVDAAAQLQSSWVTQAEFATATAWSAPQPLAERVLAFAAVADGEGRRHLAFLARRAAAAAPAGIFYQQAANSAAAWSAPVLLYESPYLRALDAGSVTLQLAFSPAGSLFLVWENPLLEQVFFNRSADGGANWDEPMLFDQRAPDDLADAAGPARPLVYASSNATVHLLWTAGHGANACRLYHQWSNDNGAGWQPAQPLPLTGCPQTIQLLAAADAVAPLLLFAVLPTQSALLAWDGQQWSLPQFQTGLSAFRHPATYRPLALGCQQTALATADWLLLIGCDTTQSQDIWAASRPVAALAEWFPPPPVWQEPVMLSAAASSAPTLAVDGDGLVHLVWSQPENAGAASAAIHYARWDGANWSLPAPVLRLPGGAGSPSLTVDSRGRLLLVAASGSGALYFSQAAAATAGNNWSEPLALPQPPAAAMMPVIAAGSNAIYVVYAVPFNEARGIYLTQSPDGGSSWSDPITVFAAAAAGWAGVAWPRLALTSAAVDSLHVTWARTEMPSLTAATALYASHSADGGRAFTPAEMVADNSLRWHDLLTDGGQTLHRLWQTADSGGEGNRAVLWHQASEDGGVTWQTAQRVSTQSGPVAAAAGPGQAQLLQWTEETLQQWQWQGGQWLPAESLALPAAMDGAGMIAGITPNGTLLALFYGSAVAPDALFFTSRRVSLPTVLPAPRPIASSTPPSTLAPTATPLALPTATQPFPREATEGNLHSAANSPLPPATSSASLLLRVVLSVIPAGIFVVLVLFRSLRKRRER